MQCDRWACVYSLRLVFNSSLVGCPKQTNMGGSEVRCENYQRTRLENIYTTLQQIVFQRHVADLIKCIHYLQSSHNNL